MTKEEIAALQAENEELKKELAEEKKARAASDKAKAEVEEAFHDAVAKLEEKDAEAAASTALPIVTIDKVKYQVTIPKFKFKGKEYTAKDVKEDKGLAAELAKIQWGGFKELEK